MTIIDVLLGLLASATPGRVPKTVADLQASVDELRASAQRFSAKGFYFDDEVFAINPADWSRLSSASNDAAFNNMMKQSTDHSCLLNACRFALQKRLNVFIGAVVSENQTGCKNSGDWIIDCIIHNATNVQTSADFPTRAFDTLPANMIGHSIKLDEATNWLAALGLHAGDIFVTRDFDVYYQDAQQGGTLAPIMFVSGKAGDADHTYVLHELQSRGGHAVAKIYDPWTGAPYRSALMTCPGDLCEVGSFLGIDGLRVDLHGQADPAGQNPFYQILPVYLS
jgi:hypothetical protein